MVNRKLVVGARVGALLGVLFVPRGQGPSFVVMRKVNHFPEPGMPEAKTATRMLTSRASGGSKCFPAIPGCSRPSSSSSVIGQSPVSDADS